MDDELGTSRTRRSDALKASPVLKVVGGIIDVTDDDLQDAVETYDLLIVDFWAEWCMPCRMLAPILEQLAERFPGELTIGKLNVDQNQRTAAEFGVFSIPTLIVFKDGKPVRKAVGLLPLQSLEKMVKEVRSS
jgi:thioredoxin 1